MPTFCIGRAEYYDGPIEEWLRIPKARVPGDAKLGAELIDACLDSGFDPSFSDELLFDHATFLPLHFLNPNMAVPVVPVIHQYTDATHADSQALLCLGRNFSARSWSKAKRIALIATGGLSHWPGEAKHGKINIPFDKKFLETLVNGDRTKLTEYTHEEINSEAGSGGHEIRTWIALAGAVQNWKAELLAYEPVVPWATGCGLVAFSQ